MNTINIFPTQYLFLSQEDVEVIGTIRITKVSYNVIRQVNLLFSSNNNISRMASRDIPHILKNFDLPDNLSGNFKAKCRYCHKDTSGCMRSTSNFIKHIKRNHLLKHQTENRNLIFSPLRARNIPLKMHTSLLSISFYCRKHDISFFYWEVRS